MRSLFRAYNELLTILTKIIKSQDEDIKMLITEIATIQSDSQTLVDQLNLCLVLERQQKELIDYMDKQNRNAYIYGNVVTTIPGLLVMAKGFADLAMSGADPVKVDMAWKWIAAGAITELGMHVVYPQCLYPSDWHYQTYQRPLDLLARMPLQYRRLVTAKVTQKSSLLSPYTRLRTFLQSDMLD